MPFYLYARISIPVEIFMIASIEVFFDNLIIGDDDYSFADILGKSATGMPGCAAFFNSVFEIARLKIDVDPDVVRLTRLTLSGIFSDRTTKTVIFCFCLGKGKGKKQGDDE